MPCFYLNTILGPHCPRITPSVDPQPVTDSSWYSPSLFLTHQVPNMRIPHAPLGGLTSFLAGIALPPFQNLILQASTVMMSSPFPTSCKHPGLLSGQLKNIPISISTQPLTVTLHKLPNLSGLTLLLSKMGVMIYSSPGQRPRASALPWRKRGECGAGLNHSWVVPTKKGMW